MVCHTRSALPTRRALVTDSPYTLPRYMLLGLPRDVIHSVAASDFVPTLYELKL